MVQARMEFLAIQLAGVIGLGIGASWLAWRLRLPSILLLLIVGFAAGPVTGLLDPDALLGDLLFPLVSLSVAVILFEGGLSLDIRELREIGIVVRNLATVGVAVTWAAATLLARLFLGFDWSLATLLGAVLVVTGPTVIVPLLRHVRPSPRVGAAMKWEGIVNDPIGAILAVLVFEAILAGGSGQLDGAITGMIRAALFGAGFGLVGAALLVFPLKRYWIPDHLQNPAALAVALLVFVGTNALQHESGLLAVTVMGSALASQRLVGIEHIVEFKENLRVLLISVLFIVLAGRIPPSMLTADLGGIAFVAGLILLVRPAAVVCSTLGTGLPWRERFFLAAVAPRGIVAAAVSSIFALDLVTAGLADAERLIPVTFLVIVTTVVVYGTGASPLARRLRLASPDPQGLLIVGADPWIQSLAKMLQSEGVIVSLIDSNWAHVSAARRLGLVAHHGNVLSERVMEEMELDGIGNLLGLTSNDEVNALAALHFAEVFGNSRVYQLAPGQSGSNGKDRTLPTNLRGRLLFDPGTTHSRITARVEAGASVEKITVAEDSDIEGLKGRHGRDVIPLFTLQESGKLTVVTVDDVIRTRAGQSVICLVGPAASDD
jgi:NhaP-type Na+/H+ or K+/H+ antiporter